MTNNFREYAQQQADIQEQEAYLERNRVTPPGQRYHECPYFDLNGQPWVRLTALDEDDSQDFRAWDVAGMDQWKRDLGVRP